ncbi:MAG: hypothetical protein QGF09_16745, partial [Rhodospirillales bacterium]|nr:hypothetical protein [Rhodospirillales bacterium]
LPVFTIPFAWKDASSIILYTRISLGEIQAGVLGLVLLGIAFLLAGFWGSRKIIFGSVPRFRFPGSVREVNLSLLLWPLLLAHMVFEYFPDSRIIPALGQFLRPGSLIALGGFYFLWRRGQLSVW